MLKCGQFISKSYVFGGLFCFLVSNFCNKSMNNIYDGINESDAFGIYVYVISILVICLDCLA
jgi:hypothetical protein